MSVQTKHSGHPEQTVRRRRQAKITTEKKIADDEFMAAAIGDVEWLKQSFRDDGPVVNYDKNGLAAIHLAAIHGRIDCLKMCIDGFKTDVDLPSTTGWRPVHLCINKQTGKRSLQCLAYLIEKGANCSVANDDGITPAHQAASEGLELCLKMLIEADAKLDSKDCRGNTPLDLAKLWGHRKCSRILAAEMWHQDKDHVAKEIQLLKKIKMHQVLNKFEEAEKKREIKEISGDKAFKQWLTNKALEEKSSEQSRTPNMESNKENMCRKNSVFRESKETEAQNKSQINLSLNVNNKSIDTPNRVINEKVDENLLIENNRNAEKSVIKKSVKWEDNSTDVFQLHWNKSTRLKQNQYTPNLNDDFPRDEYTLMPQVKGAPKFFEGKFAYPMTPDTIREDVKKKRSATKLRQPNLPSEVINSVLSQDSTANDRGMIFKCKHIYDIRMKKKFDSDIIGRSEAPLHLTNDINSFLVRNSVRLGYTIPKISSPKLDVDSKYKKSQWIDENCPLPVIMHTLETLSMPTHFPSTHKTEN